VYSYSRPIYQLGPPINDPQTTILPPASQVERELNALKNLDMSTIQDIRVGYELKREMDYQGVFILEPVWMYLDNNSWSKVIFTETDELGGGM
jgi:regulatory protein YycH of two-component signal transduction system YycFG